MLFKSLNQLFNTSSSSLSSMKSKVMVNNTVVLKNLETLNSVEAVDHHYNNIFTRPQMYTF